VSHQDEPIAHAANNGRVRRRSQLNDSVVNCGRLAIRHGQEGCRLFFDFVAARGDQGVLYGWRESYGIHLSAWAHEIFDLAGTGSNLLARVTRARRKKFIEHAVRSRDRLILAERARTRDSAIDHLGKALRMRG
jgi:hypothetical protein